MVISQIRQAFREYIQRLDVDPLIRVYLALLNPTCNYSDYLNVSISATEKRGVLDKILGIWEIKSLVEAFCAGKDERCASLEGDSSSELREALAMEVEELLGARLANLVWEHVKIADLETRASLLVVALYRVLTGARYIKSFDGSAEYGLSFVLRILSRGSLGVDNAYKAFYNLVEMGVLTRHEWYSRKHSDTQYVIPEFVKPILERALGDDYVQRDLPPDFKRVISFIYSG